MYNKDWLIFLREHRKKFLTAPKDSWPGLLEKQYQLTVSDWKALYPQGHFGHDVMIDSGSREAAEKFKNPMDALMHFLELDCYPPPELLYVFADFYYQYMASDGTPNLQERLLGAPGNVAKQQRKALDSMLLGIEMLTRDHKQLTKIEVAERFVDEHGLSIDPESLLRRYDRFKSSTDKEESEDKD